MWVCPNKEIEKKKQQIKEEWQKKMWMMLIVKLLIVILGLWNPETLFEPYESFSFITKNHSLRYVPLEVLSNEASKQPGTIKNALKMQRKLFHKIHDIKNKLLIIIHVNKWMFKKRQIFLIQNLELFLEPFSLKQKVISWCIFTEDLIAKHEQIIYFPRKKITKDVTRVRRRGENYMVFPFSYLQCKSIYIYGDTRKYCLLWKWNGSRHLVFWSIGTLTGLRDRVRGLVA